MTTNQKYQAEYYQANKAATKAHQAAYRAAHKVEKKKYMGSYYEAHREEIIRHKANRPKPHTTVSGRWGSLRGGARARDLEVTITKKEFEAITASPCFYCGKNSPGRETVGVDRYDNSKGYIPGNCVPCCSMCNHMKKDFTVGEWFDHLESIIKWSV